MKRIMIVDDQLEVLKSHTRYLRTKDYEMITLNDVDTARRIYRPDEIALVVCDNDCPQHNSGRDWLKELQPNQKVLLMSGKNVEDLGDLPLIAKPFRPSRLLARILEILGDTPTTQPDQSGE